MRPRDHFSHFECWPPLLLARGDRLTITILCIGTNAPLNQLPNVLAYNLVDFPDNRVVAEIGTTSGVKPMNLKSMSIDKLSKLREQVDAAFNAKVIEERRVVQDQLSKLERLAAGGARGRGVRGRPRGAVAPKYRNPDNPAETWAGRGLKPRWLAAALKSG
jgi:DNA-binding protein H-NS